MKCLKPLGLAAVSATALMAFVGASSASATVLCTTNSNPCGTGWHYTGTIHATLESGSTAILRDTTNSIIDTCPASTIHLESTTTGSSTTTPVGAFGANELTWSASCTHPTATTAGGSLEIHATSGGNGTITAKEAKVTIEVAGLNCIFGAGEGINLGTYTAATKTLAVNTVVERGVGGPFLCPKTAAWTANYVLTTPANLFAEAS